MISKNLNQTIQGISISNTIYFIGGFLLGNPTKNNPYWVQIKKIMGSKKQELLNELGTDNVHEQLKIIKEMSKKTHTREN